MIEFSRPVSLDRIGTAPTEHRVAADAAECERVAARLRLPAITRLDCVFRLRRLPGSVVEGEGRLAADVTQLCVVTLEPFAQTVEEVFTVRFVPAGSETDDADPDTPDEIVYAGGTIDLGEAATEQLALALDPYPRSPGAALEFEPDPEPGTLAGLAALQRKQ